MGYRVNDKSRPIAYWSDWNLHWFGIDERGEIASFFTNATDWSPLHLEVLLQVAEQEEAAPPLEHWGDAVGCGPPPHDPYWLEHAGLGVWAYEAKPHLHVFQLEARPVRPRLLQEMPAGWARRSCALYFRDFSWRDFPSIATAGPTEPRWLDHGVLWSSL